MISKTLRDLRSSLNQPLKSADDIGILQNRIQTDEYVDFFLLVNFNFLWTLMLPHFLFLFAEAGPN
jgi:hypothetical protein